MTTIDKTKQIITPPPGFAKNQKFSIGIACLRYNSSGQLEILLIQKRYTYAYSDFVQGKYNMNTSSQTEIKKNKQDLVNLFSGMTVQEKLDIMSLNFEQIWYRVWLNATKSHTYYNKMRSKFDSTFVIDNGSRLRKLISKSTNSSVVWEIPKGKKRPKETDINCAIREFAEETNICKRAYTFIPEMKRVYKFSDDGVEYINTYYIAMIKHDIDPIVNFSSQEQINEVSNIKWMTVDTIKTLETNANLTTFVRALFKSVKNREKKIKNSI